MAKVAVDTFSLEDGDKTEHKNRKAPVLLKMTLFIVCSIGFLYQVMEFLNIYWTYPTIIDMKIRRNGTFVMPALTFCLIDNAAGIKFCEKHPVYCRAPNEDDPICEQFPTYCKKGIKVPYVHLRDSIANLFLKDIMEFENVPNFRSSYIQNRGEMDGPFFYAPVNSMNVLICYIMYSRVESRKDMIRIEMDADAYENDAHPKMKNSFRYIFLNNTFNRNDTEGIAVAIHSPLESVIPTVDNILQFGHAYDLHIQLEDETLLPCPYATDCSDYTESWKSNNVRVGPKTKKMCTELCKMEYDLACYGCVDTSNTYPNNLTRCFTKGSGGNSTCNKGESLKYRECTSSCKMECLKIKYKYTIKEKSFDIWSYLEYEKNTILIEVFLAPDMLVYKHRQQYQFVEVFSNIGGYLGIWLGISLFTLADIFKNLLAFIRPRWRRFRAERFQEPESGETRTIWKICLC